MLYLINWYVLLLLFALIVLDCVTGVIAAAVRGSLDSSKMRTGLLHKATYVLVLVFAVVVVLLGNEVDLGFDLTGVIVAVIVWIALTECVSIIENLVEINPSLKGNPFFVLFAKREDLQEKVDESLSLKGADDGNPS